MPELLPERTKMFEITCDWKGEPKTALIIVYFGKNGKVEAFSPADQGFWLTHRKRPLNWATWELRHHLQKDYQMGNPVPSDEDFWKTVLEVGMACGASREVLLSISPRRLRTSEDAD